MAGRAYAFGNAQGCQRAAYRSTQRGTFSLSPLRMPAAGTSLTFLAKFEFRLDAPTRLGPLTCDADGDRRHHYSKDANIKTRA
jgi:hypothetical protein